MGFSTPRAELLHKYAFNPLSFLGIITSKVFKTVQRWWLMYAYFYIYNTIDADDLMMAMYQEVCCWLLCTFHKPFLMFSLLWLYYQVKSPWWRETSCFQFISAASAAAVNEFCFSCWNHQCWTSYYGQRKYKSGWPFHLLDPRLWPYYLSTSLSAQ